MKKRTFFSIGLFLLFFTVFSETVFADAGANSDLEKFWQTLDLKEVLYPPYAEFEGGGYGSSPVTEIYEDESGGREGTARLQKGVLQLATQSFSRNNQVLGFDWFAVGFEKYGDLLNAQKGFSQRKNMDSVAGNIEMILGDESFCSVPKPSEVYYEWGTPDARVHNNYFFSCVKLTGVILIWTAMQFDMEQPRILSSLEMQKIMNFSLKILSHFEDRLYWAAGKNFSPTPSELKESDIKEILMKNSSTKESQILPPKTGTLKDVFYAPGEELKGLITASNINETDVDAPGKYGGSSLRKQGVLEEVSQTLIPIEGNSFGLNEFLVFASATRYKNEEGARRAFMQSHNAVNNVRKIPFSGIGDEALCSAIESMRINEKGERMIDYINVCAFRYQNIFFYEEFVLKGNEKMSEQEMKEKVIQFARKHVSIFAERIYQYMGKTVSVGPIMIQPEYPQETNKSETVIEDQKLIPIPLPEIGQCRPYLNGVRQGLVGDKQFWRDVNRKLNEVKGSYADVQTVRDLLAQAKVLIIAIDKAAKKGACNQEAITKIQDNLDNLHTKIFSELSTHLTDMEELYRLRKKRGNLESLQRKILNLMLRLSTRVLSAK